MSRQQWRQELAGGRLQPSDEHDVHADAEHVHDGDHHHDSGPERYTAST